MKKLLLMTAVAVALSLMSCNGNTDYKAKGEQMSKQLDEQVEQNDTAGALASDDAIRKVEADVVATGDSAAIADFRAAMKDARVRNAAFVTIAKIKNGMDREEAIKELVNDALKSDVNIQAVTAAINAILKAEDLPKETKQPKQQETKSEATQQK